MRIALASCAELPPHEHDDVPLVAALRARGCAIDSPAWDDPAVDWTGFDAVLIRTTWDYMERRDEYVAWAERVERTTLLVNDAGVVRWNTRKDYLRRFAELGFPSMPSVWLARGEAPDLAELVREHGWSAAFLKPVVGATARETLRFAADGEGLALAQAHAARVLAAEDLILQPYYAAVEQEGELSAVFVDGAFTHGVRKVPVRGDYRVQDDFGAADEPWAFAPDELRLAREIVAAAGKDLLYARVDFLRDARGALHLNELELVEPSLFFRHGPHAAVALADALLRRLVS